MVLLFQKAVKNDKTYMASVVRFAFTSKKGIVFPKEVIKAMGQEYNPGKLDEWVQDFSKHQLFKNKKEDRSPPFYLYVISETELCSLLFDELTAKL